MGDTPVGELMISSRSTARRGRDDLSSGSIEALVGGVLGGLAAWLLVEKSGWFADVLYGTGSLGAGTHRLHLQIALGGVFGACVGMALSVAGYKQWNTRSQLAVPTVVSGIVAATGGGLGIWLGQLLYDRLLSGVTAQNVISVSLAARCAGWGIIGLITGAAQGAVRREGRVAAFGIGSLGGLLGGVAGGAVFEALQLVAASPSIARLIGFMFVGGAIGFLPKALSLLVSDKNAALSNTAVENGTDYQSDMNSPPSQTPQDSPFESDSRPLQQSRTYIAAQLVGVEGPYAGIIFPLREQKTDIVLGRLTDCDVCLMNDRTISRRHALLRRDEQTGEFRLEDLRSANGTGVNSVRLHPNQPQVLAMRDLVNLGASTLRFEWVGPAPEAHS